MFEDGFGFERYAEWLVDQVPMYFVYRDGEYIDVAGASFRDFMDGRLHNVAGTDRHRGRLRRPHDHGVHRRPAQAVPGDARRRRRPRRT